MSLIWRKEMSTGLDWQDDQHKQILNRIDQLLEAMEKHEGAGVVKELIDFLGDYARDHFRDEEEYMQKHHCTTSLVHKQCHEDFIAQLTSL